MNHTHPEIQHPDARRLLAVELMIRLREFPPKKYPLSWRRTRECAEAMARRFDLYLRG